MTNYEKIQALILERDSILADLEQCKPGRCTAEDIEDVSDNYQANLEYGWYRDEQMELVDDINAQIRHLDSLPMYQRYIEPMQITGNIRLDDIPITSDGLRYVSEEVGWVDQDEEYY